MQGNNRERLNQVNKSCPAQQNYVVYLSLSFLACLITIVGLGISFGLCFPSHSKIVQLSQNILEEKDFLIQELMKSFEDTKDLEEIAKWIAAKPHPTGHPRDSEISIWIQKRFSRIGIQYVETDNHTLILSFPNSTSEQSFRSKVELIDQNGNVEFSTLNGGNFHYVDNAILSQRTGTPYFEESNLQPYCPFSQSGIIEGQVIYANYASDEDFKYLKSIGVIIQDRIVIARNGKVFQSSKVENAEKFGAKGLLLYDEQPFEDSVSRDLYEVEHSKTLARNIILNVRPKVWTNQNVESFNDDRLKPDWSPRILVHPISNNHAKIILGRLSGRDAPQSWIGTIEGITYKIGGEFLFGPLQRSRMMVNNKMVPTQVSNILASIKGSVEPDRYVIVGNERASWSSGLHYPSSGTATLVSVATAIKSLMRRYSWTPRRSIIFAVFGGGDFGPIGKWQWVSKRADSLKKQAVGYINADLCSGGSDLLISASDILKPLLNKAMRFVHESKDGTVPQPDTWSENSRTNSFSKPYLKESYSVRDLIFCHDIYNFSTFSNIPSIDIKFAKNSSNLPQWCLPGMYYLDDSRNLERWSESHVNQLKSCAQVLASTLIQLSEPVFLPYDLNSLAENLLMSVVAARAGPLEYQLRTFNASMSGLHFTVLEYVGVVKNFTDSLESIELKNPISVRITNDKILQAFKIFGTKMTTCEELKTGMQAFSSESPEQFSTFDLFPCIKSYLERSTSTSYDEKVLMANKIEKHFDELIQLVQQSGHYLV